PGWAAKALMGGRSAIRSSNRAPNDQGDGDEQRGDEDCYRDVAAFELGREIDFRCESIDEPIAQIHQHYAKGGIDEVQSENGQLHAGSRSVELGGESTDNDARRAR